YTPMAFTGGSTTPTEPPPGLRPDDTIKIVRNVQGNFEEYDSGASHPPTIHTGAHKGLAFSEGLEEENQSVQSSLKGETVSHKEFYEHNKKVPLEETKLSKTVSSKNKATSLTNTFTINLYSEVTKDADFHKMWKELSEILKENIVPHIVINLDGIHFLYEKEMEYLEKINAIIKNSGGTLTFVNCDRDLFELFNRHPQLLTLLKKM
ncbi:MAG: hypothetical protein N2053_07255, partial [Chitinispirillaceae bacterium]|nr:hypothetical protein [Chitinispirillaceae bacterium]